MGIFYAYGGALIDEDEIQSKTENGQFAEFADQAERSPGSAAIDFSTGRMRGDEFRSGMAWPVAARLPFEPIGIGKPLTIEIRHVYSGRFPKKNLFRRSADMVVTSAIKSSPVISEATTAINFLRRDVKARTGFSTPHADEFGTPVVFYSPALAQRNTTLTIKFGFDEFPGDQWDRFAEVLAGAAGMPLFSPASLHLHGASAVASLVSRLGETLFDRHAAFRATESITFARPGSSIPVANFALMMPDEEAERQILKTHIIRGGKLVHAQTDLPYDGDAPYVVISLDGRRNDELNHFMSKSAASLMLSDLSGVAGSESTHLEELQEAAEIYHDFRLRRRVDRIAREIAAEDPGSESATRLRLEREALIANIQTAALRPQTAGDRSSVPIAA